MFRKMKAGSLLLCLFVLVVESYNLEEFQNAEKENLAVNQQSAVSEENRYYFPEDNQPQLRQYQNADEGSLRDSVDQQYDDGQPLAYQYFGSDDNQPQLKEYQYTNEGNGEAAVNPQYDDGDSLSHQYQNFLSDINQSQRKDKRYWSVLVNEGKKGICYVICRFQRCCNRSECHCRK